MLSCKVTELAEAARYDVCLASCSSGKNGLRGRSRSPQNPLTEWIYPASVPGRGRVHILKILQSNHCKNNCSYCKFARTNDTEKRISLSPDELASSFIELVRSRLVEGLFLSSGVCGSADRSMENMCKTADIIRNRYKFNGYIHLKIIPGCSTHLIESAAALADRLSINMEAPTDEHLHRIAPDKVITTDILPALSKVSDILNSRRDGSRWIKTNSQTTQYVVGASDETDLEIFKSVDMLYRDYNIFRAYFSAYQVKYNPSAAIRSKEIPDAQDSFSGSPLLREHRLYQCDFLLRAYGFRFPDLVFNRMNNIPLETDPKTAWAVVNPAFFPVEINTAPFSELLRVPGIGPVAAERIVSMRKEFRINDIETLKQSGAWTKRAAGWIELNGKTPYVERGASAGKKNGKQLFDSNQKWLFEELAPSGWSCGGKEKNMMNGYDYPGQKGKWVNYRFRKDEPKIMCR